MVLVRVRWARKSCVGQRYPFNVPRPEEWDVGRYAGERQETLDVSPDMIYLITPKQWDKIAKTLNDFAFNHPQYFVATDKKRWLAIDTQGFDYPRYKSHLTEDAIRVLKIALIAYYEKHKGI